MCSIHIIDVEECHHVQRPVMHTLCAVEVLLEVLVLMEVARRMLEEIEEPRGPV